MTNRSTGTGATSLTSGARVTQIGANRDGSLRDVQSGARLPDGEAGAPNLPTRRIDPMHMTHRVAFRPRYESRAKWQSPGRREFVHGPIVPMNSEASNALWWWLCMAVASPFVASFLGGLA